MDKRKNNLSKKKYIKILIALFLINALIAIGGSEVKQRLGYYYVFHSWLDITHSVAWVLMVGLVLIIPLTCINVWLGGIVIPFILIGVCIGADIGYHKEIRQGKYIVTETQQLGEKAIRYYEDINIFIMKMSHEEYIYK
jgi:H+/Cl- antiporter ClcA